MLPVASAGASFQRLEHERGVPRGDEPGDADRLAVDVVELAAGHLVGVVGLGDDQVGEEAEVLGGALGLAEGLGDRQAGVEGLQLGEAGVAGLDDVGDPVQDPGRARAAASAATGRSSNARVAAATAAVDVGLLAGGGRDVGLVRDRVEHVEGVAVDGVDELAVDVVLDAGGQVVGNEVLAHVLAALSWW